MGPARRPLSQRKCSEAAAQSTGARLQPVLPSRPRRPAMRRRSLFGCLTSWPLLRTGRYEALWLPQEPVPLPHRQPGQAVDPGRRGGARRATPAFGCGTTHAQGSLLAPAIISSRDAEHGNILVQPFTHRAVARARTPRRRASRSHFILPSLSPGRPPGPCSLLHSLLCLPFMCSFARPVLTRCTPPPSLLAAPPTTPGARCGGQGQGHRRRHRRHQVRHLQGAGQGPAACAARRRQGQVLQQAGGEEDQGGRRRLRPYGMNPVGPASRVLPSVPGSPSPSPHPLSDKASGCRLGSAA